MLSGNGGQKVYLVPTLDLIAVSTGNAFFVESPMNDIMSRVLLPAFLSKDRSLDRALATDDLGNQIH